MRRVKLFKLTLLDYTKHMKDSLIILVTIVFIISCNSSGKSSSMHISRVTRELKQLEYNALLAEFKMDTAAIAVIMDDGFVSIDEQKVSNKQTELAGIYNNIHRRLKEGHTVDSFYLDQFRVDLFDNTAVVTFFTVTKGRIKDKPYENKRTRFYDVWVKKKGVWKLVSMQATFL